MVPSLSVSPGWHRRLLVMALAAVLMASGDAVLASPLGEPGRHTRHRFRAELSKTVQADHPFTAPVAEAIRQLSDEPREQLVIVERVTKLLVEYDSDARVYQRRDYHATLDEMIARSREAGWTYLRDDCDGRAIFAAHLLAALEIPWRLEGSYWKGHAWVSAEVEGMRYDLLDLRRSDPEMQRASYRLLGRLLTRRSNPPPPFAWRQAWRERTHGDLVIAQRLGLIDQGAPAGKLVERFVVNHLETSRISASEHPRRELGGSPGGE